MSDLVERAKRVRLGGGDIDDVLTALRRDGATMIESVKVVRELESLPLEKAKEVVDASTTWNDRHSMNDRLREVAINALQDESED